MNSFHEEKLKFRQRILQHLSMALGMVVLTGCLLSYIFTAIESLTFAITVGAGVSFITLGFFMRRRIQFTPFIAHGFLLTYALSIGLVSMLGRGFTAQLLAGLLLMPVFSTFLLGRRAGGFYTILTFLILAIVFWVDIQQFIKYPPFTLDDSKKDKMLVFGAVVMASLAMAYAFDHSRKLMEKNLIDLNSSLEQEKQKVEQTLAIKTRFLANMSHEIRTPMNGILGMTNLLRNATKEPDLLKKIEIIEVSGKLLLGIIDDILDFSKVEAGRMSLERIPVQMAQLIHETTGLVEGKAQEKHITIVANVRDCVPAYIIGDPIRIKQVLINLLGNAIKFSSESTVDVELSTSYHEGNRLWVQISVKDRGIGIDRASQDGLFKPFSQADLSTTRKFGGTGLGLALSKNFVELMGGRIWVESEVGKGSTFSFSFPTEITTIDVRELKDADSIPAGAPEIFTLQILVAEDNQINRTVADGILRNIGYYADFATNGAQALQAASNKPYDIIFMDCHMPEMDGFEATVRIRNLPMKHRPLIVALTASVMTNEKERCLQSGMDKFLSKPLQQKAIKTIIDEYAETHHLQPIAYEIAN